MVNQDAIQKMFNSMNNALMSVSKKANPVNPKQGKVYQILRSTVDELQRNPEETYQQIGRYLSKEENATAYLIQAVQKTMSKTRNSL